MFIEEDSLGTAKTFGDNSVVFALTAKATLYRLRGSGFVGLIPGAANDVMQFALGAIVVSDEAAVAGVASVPGPLTDANAPWWWYYTTTLNSGVDTAQDGASNLSNARFEIDTKAMRKVGPNQRVVFVAEGTIHGGAPTLTCGASARILIGT